MPDKDQYYKHIPETNVPHLDEETRSMTPDDIHNAIQKRLEALDEQIR